MKEASIEHRPLIAIVDDDITQARLISMMLEEQYDVCIANKGKEAIKMIKSRSPDLVLLDVVMPDINGHEVNECLKQNPYTFDIPVIFVTSLGDVENETMALVSGAADYVMKPVNPDVLHARISRVLDLSTYVNFLMRMIEEKDIKIESLKKQAQAMLDKHQRTPSMRA